MVVYFALGKINLDYAIQHQLENYSYITFSVFAENRMHLVDVQFIMDDWQEQIWQIYAESISLPEIPMSELLAISAEMGGPTRWTRVMGEKTLNFIHWSP